MQAKKNAPADPKQPKELGKPLIAPAQIMRLRFNSAGTQLAAGCMDGTVRRWDVTGKDPTDLPPIAGLNGWVQALEFGPTGLFTGSSWGALTAWDCAESEAKKLWSVGEAHDGWVRMAATAPDGDTVATCGRDGFVRVWGAKDGKKQLEINVGADTLAVAFAPDRKQILAGDMFGIVHIFDLASGKLARTLEAKELHRLIGIQDVGGVHCLAFDTDGKTVFVAGAEPKTAGFIQAAPVLIAFDWASGKRSSSWKGANDNEGFITDLLWHPSGYAMGTCSGQPGQGKFFGWRPGAAQPHIAVARPNCHSLALHPDKERVAVAATNANSAGNGRPKGKTEYPHNNSPVSFWQLPKATG